MNTQTPARTRIAPSPTGDDLHIGNAYTALINFVVSRQTGGQFLIRIEDTDRARLVNGAETRILASLAWLGIQHDEGPDIGGPFAPYRQSDRLPVYKKHAEELVSTGYAYYCFCTSERLEEMRKKQEADHKPPMYDGLCKMLPKEEVQKRLAGGEKHVIRLNVPATGVTKFTDLIRGEIAFENALVDDQVLLKSDGFPTYHLGVVVDDHIMGITHIIRGEEWIPSTPKHIFLYQCFGWDMPQFAHVSVLRNPDKSKLSKRKNPVWVSWFKKEGFLPEAILNYLGTMAWAFPGGKEIFSVEEMMKIFRIENIQTTAPVFDMEKLRWMNGEYIRRISVSDLKKRISGYFEKKYDGDLMDKILPLVVERMRTLKEFESLSEFFFTRPTQFERPVDERRKIIVRDALASCDWTHDAMEQAIRQAAEKHGLKARDVFMELRVAVTGKTVGPPLLESLEILGTEETLTRLK